MIPAFAGSPRLLAAGLATALLGAPPAWAENTPVRASNACKTEIAAASHRHGIPEAVAMIVAKVESGHDALALNIAGWPARARSVADGVVALRRLQAAGIKSVDVGCMQINLKHHPQAFDRLEDAFDPRTNADYGVRLLKRLFAETRSWGKAIASYHSRDPDRQRIYLEAVKKTLGRHLSGRAD